MEIYTICSIIELSNNNRFMKYMRKLDSQIIYSYRFLGSKSFIIGFDDYEISKFFNDIKKEFGDLFYFCERENKQLDSNTLNKNLKEVSDQIINLESELKNIETKKIELDKQILVEDEKIIEKEEQLKKYLKDEKDQRQLKSEILDKAKELRNQLMLLENKKRNVFNSFFVSKGINKVSNSLDENSNKVSKVDEILGTIGNRKLEINNDIEKIRISKRNLQRDQAQSLDEYDNLNTQLSSLNKKFNLFNKETTLVNEIILEVEKLIQKSFSSEKPINYSQFIDSNNSLRENNDEHESKEIVEQKSEQELDIN